MEARVTGSPEEAVAWVRAGETFDVALHIRDIWRGTYRSDRVHDFLVRGGERAPRLGIVPMGTANDLANAIGIPGSIEEAVREMKASWN